jgi:hypothetical protein
LLLKGARKMGPRLAALNKRAQKACVTCIYVNDNFGKWKSDFNAQFAHCPHRVEVFWPSCKQRCHRFT